MKKYLFLLILTGIIFASCSNLGNLADKEKSDSYFIASNGQITYCQGGNWFELGSTPMQADAKSFKVLSTEIAEDKNFVFYCGYAQKQVDRKTFYIENKIPKDRFYAYSPSDGKLTRIEGADAKTFEYINDNLWARDKNSYFLDLRKLNVDRKTFSFINKTFSQDKDSIYIVTGSEDFKSVLKNTGDAKAINEQYMKIGKVIYYVASRPVPKLLKDTFAYVDNIRIIDNDIICVNHQVISYGRAFNYDKVDVQSFRLYPPDRHQVMNDFYSRDKNNVYYDGELIKDADVNTYTPLSFGFGKDAKNAYYGSTLLKGVDGKSFDEIETHDSGGFVFRDKFGNKFDYMTGKRIL